MFDIGGLRFGEPCGRGKLQVFPLYGPDIDHGFVGNVKVIGDNGGYGQACEQHLFPGCESTIDRILLGV